MRTRNIKLNVFLNERENNLLKQKSKEIVLTGKHMVGMIRLKLIFHIPLCQNTKCKD